MFKIDRKIHVSSPRSDSHRSGDAMSESLTPAPVIQFVASTTGLCGLFPCRVRRPVRPPLVCAMVLGIDALEHRREVEGGGLTGANCELFHSVAFRRQRNHSVGDGMKECMKQMHLKINMHALVGKQLQKIHRHSASACVKQAKKEKIWREEEVEKYAVFDKKDHEEWGGGKT